MLFSSMGTAVFWTEGKTNWTTVSQWHRFVEGFGRRQIVFALQSNSLASGPCKRPRKHLDLAHTGAQPVERLSLNIKSQGTSLYLTLSQCLLNFFLRMCSWDNWVKCLFSVLTTLILLQSLNSPILVPFPCFNQRLVKGRWWSCVWIRSDPHFSYHAQHTQTLGNIKRSKKKKKQVWPPLLTSCQGAHTPSHWLWFRRMNGKV